MYEAMRVFVTGANGFVGKHLVKALTERGHEVFAGIRNTLSDVPSSIKVYHYDLLHDQEVDSLLKEILPNGIIHLASQSNIGNSWKNPEETFKVNTIGTIRLLQAAKQIVPAAKIIIAGSSEEYGLTGKKFWPLRESYPCQPQNPYAVSKLAMGQIALQLANIHHLNVIHVRPFNHFGPGQRLGFVISDFASQIAKIETNLSLPILKTGDLSAIRDFTDVRDVIEAYILLLEKDVSTGIYNICSGIHRSISSILQDLLKMSSRSIQVEKDPNRSRPSEVPLFSGSMEKLNKATGWTPKIPYQKSIFETLQFWRIQSQNDNSSQSH